MPVSWSTPTWALYPKCHVLPFLRNELPGRVSYDVEMSKKFIAGALERGLYFHYYGDAPYPAHCGFSIQHTTEDIAVTLERIDDIFKTLK